MQLKYKIISIPPRSLVEKPHIDTPMQSHGGMYQKVVARVQEIGAPILIFNLDAHDDRYDDDVSDDRVGSWANDLEMEGLAVTIHLYSYWRDGTTFATDTNWHEEHHGRSIIQFIDMMKAHMSFGETWVTIDYDYFSLRIGPQQNIYDYSKDYRFIQKELRILTQFLQQNNINIQRVVPAISQPWLNIDRYRQLKEFLVFTTTEINLQFAGLFRKQQGHRFPNPKSFLINHSLNKLMRLITWYREFIGENDGSH